MVIVTEGYRWFTDPLTLYTPRGGHEKDWETSMHYLPLPNHKHMWRLNVAIAKLAHAYTRTKYSQHHLLSVFPPCAELGALYHTGIYLYRPMDDIPIMVQTDHFFTEVLK